MKLRIALAVGVWLVMSGVLAYLAIRSGHGYCSELILDFSSEMSVATGLGPWKVKFRAVPGPVEPEIEAIVQCHDDEPLEVGVRIRGEGVPPVEAEVVRGGVAINLTASGSEYPVSQSYYFKIPGSISASQQTLCCEIYVGGEKMRLQVKL